MTDPANQVIVGATGDLTHRLLLPGLGTLLKADHDLRLNLIGASNETMGAEEWAALVSKSLQEGDRGAQRAGEAAGASRFVTLDATNPDDLARLLERLTGPIVLSCALPPAVTMKACEALATIELPADLRLGIEKPFGSDLASARHFNELLAKLVREEQIFRIDHYLGKTTVLNLLGLRFANRIFEPVWNAQNIERVEIIADESLALEGRAGYYDRAGAMKDMIQSHLMHVLAMFAMEEPARIDAVEVRDLIAHTLRATHLWNDDPVESSRRARYIAGTVDGKQVPSYVDEEGVDPARGTETLAEVTVEVRNTRWSGVPFRLRSGKALSDGYRAITVVFRPVPHLPEGFEGECPRNVMSIGMSPESLHVSIATNGEGEKWDLEPTVLSAELGSSPVRPYGQILEGILAGDPLLTVRGDVAEECWRILEPVVEAWQNGSVEMHEYRAGSTGPTNWSSS